MLQRVFLLVLALLLNLGIPAQAQDDDVQVSADSQYIELKPAFVANYGGPGKLRYLKADIALRVNPDGMNAVRHHMPYIRHVLVMLLSRQQDEDLSTVEGREALRQAALKEVRQVLMREEGEQLVLDLLFNTFIVQK